MRWIRRGKESRRTRSVPDSEDLFNRYESLTRRGCSDNCPRGTNCATCRCHALSMQQAARPRVYELCPGLGRCAGSVRPPRSRAYAEESENASIRTCLKLRLSGI